jgi:hypothetical protein
MKNNIYYSIFLVLFILVVFFIQNETVNTFALFHTSNEENKFTDSEDAEQFIHTTIDQVNVYSNEFQNNLVLWEEGTYDNKTMIQKTEEYITNLREVVNRLENFSNPQEYISIFKSYLSSLNSEIESHKHFEKYLATGNITENEISIDLFSKALEYEMQTFGEFKKLNSQ